MSNIFGTSGSGGGGGFSFGGAAATTPATTTTGQQNSTLTFGGAPQGTATLATGGLHANTGFRASVVIHLRPKHFT